MTRCMVFLTVLLLSCCQFGYAGTELQLDEASAITGGCGVPCCKWSPCNAIPCETDDFCDRDFDGYGMQCTSSSNAKGCPEGSCQPEESDCCKSCTTGTNNAVDCGTMNKMPCHCSSGKCVCKIPSATSCTGSTDCTDKEF